MHNLDRLTIRSKNQWQSPFSVLAAGAQTFDQIIRSDSQVLIAPSFKTHRQYSAEIPVHLSRSLSVTITSPRAMNVVLKQFDPPGALIPLLLGAYLPLVGREVQRYRDGHAIRRDLNLPRRFFGRLREPVNDLEVLGSVNYLRYSPRAMVSVLVKCIRDWQGGLTESEQKILQLAYTVSAYVFEQLAVSHMLVFDVDRLDRCGKPLRVTAALLNLRTGHLDYFGENRALATRDTVPPYLQISAMLYELFSECSTTNLVFH